MRESKGGPIVSIVGIFQEATCHLTVTAFALLFFHLTFFSFNSIGLPLVSAHQSFNGVRSWTLDSTRCRFICKVTGRFHHFLDQLNNLNKNKIITKAPFIPEGTMS